MKKQEKKTTDLVIKLNPETLEFQCVEFQNEIHIVVADDDFMYEPCSDNCSLFELCGQLFGSCLCNYLKMDNKYISDCSALSYHFEKCITIR